MACRWIVSSRRIATPCSRSPRCGSGPTPPRRSRKIMAGLCLAIGNKAYSSWSLRAWLAAKHAELTFEEVVIPLDRPESAAELRRHSPSGRVPCISHGPIRVWDTLAIIETVAETPKGAKLWPTDRAQRARARAISAEMHSGFAALRRHLPMDLKRKPAPLAYPAEVAAEI